MRREYDVVIVGAGAGGGTVADRLIPLAKAGAKIAVLEAGPRYDKEYFTQREIEMMGMLWFGGAWPTADGSITLAAGKGVGGSTLMYTGVTFRLPDAVCEKWAVPGITPEDLKPRYDRLGKEINVIEPGEDMINDNNRLFKEGCDKLGWPVEKLHFNLKDCKQMGFCNLGCSVGSRQGTLEVQIPKVEAAGIEVIPNCEIKKVRDRTVIADVGPAPAGTRPGPWPEGKVEVKARRIVLSAGSPGSSAILLRSGFAGRLPALGRYFTMHPMFTVNGIQPRPIKNYQGFPKTYYTPKFSESQNHYIETAFYYPFVCTKNLGLWGRDLTEAMKQYTHFMTMIILNHDPALPSNRITVTRKGAPKLQYTLQPESIQSLCHGQAQATRIFFAAGCEKVIMPCAERRVFKAGEVRDDKLEEFISAKNYLPVKTVLGSGHPQGGCRMGTDPDYSVTNSFGQVHGYPWLYVADASLFPESSHVNPYLTIMALADRVAEGLNDTYKEWSR